MGRTNMSRRTFGKILGATGMLSLAGSGLGLSGCASAEGESIGAYPSYGKKVPEASIDPKTGKVTINEDVAIRYSSCLGCYNACGNRVCIDRTTGDVLSVGGNPYNATCAYPHLKFEAPLEDAYVVGSYANGKGNASATICERGLGTWDAYSQPARITTPMKRAGKRGEGKWKPISWDDLIKEVTEGGNLFADIGEDRHIEGLLALHDNETLIDPDQPDLGPLSNQIVELGGRGDGRTAIMERFCSAYGTKNQYYHAATCGGALMYTTSKTASMSVRADLENAEYVLWCGTFPGTTGSAANAHSKRCAARLSAGEVKMDVFDPVLSSGIVTPTQKNAQWHPIRTATNSAFTMGLLSWIIDTKAYNAEYLSFPNLKAAWDGGYASIANATHLVIVDEEHPHYRKLMRPEDAGLEAPASEDPENPKDFFVVIDADTNQPTVNELSTKALIEYEGTVNDIKVRSSFMFVKDAAFEKSLEEWADICEVPADVIEETAREFTSHGTHATVVGMGSTANMNGLDAACMFDVLHAMIGAPNMKGGACPRPSSAGTGNGERYHLGTIENAPKIKAVPISRSGKNFADSDEYKNRTAAGEKNPKPQLPWYSIPRNTDNQALTGIIHQYPYQAKILITWMFNSIQSSPGANRNAFIEGLKDTSIVPLHIACDVFMGTFATYADYYVPDTTPYESFAAFESQALWVGYSDTVRWPVVEQHSDEIPGGRHASIEAFLSDVGRICDLPGYGDNAMSDTEGKTYPLDDACDFFLKAVANIAYDGTPVDDIAAEDIQLQALDQLPETWKSCVKPEEWPKVLHVLSRGGRCHQAAEMFDEKGRCVYENDYVINLYSEKRAANIYSMTGEHSTGEMRYFPERFADLTSVEERFPRSEWPFKSTNYKPRFRSVTMLANSPIMRDLCDQNYLEINIEDAADLGIADGDTIEIVNPTGDVMTGPAMVRAGVTKGTFAVAFGYGNLALGSKDYEVDGITVAGNQAIGAGIHLQTMLDPTVEAGNCPVADPEAGVPGRSGGAYKIAKA